MSSASGELRTSAKPPASAELEGTDDLLSQMAGEEINRLLANADLETEPALPNSAPERLPEKKESPAAQPTAAAVATPAPEGIATAPAVVEDAISAGGVSDLLGSLSAGNDTQAIDDVAAILAAKVETPLPTPPPTPEPQPKQEATGFTETTRSIWWARLLDWAMLPLDPFPDGARDVVGKIAIVTTINAMLVLAYVILFR